MSSIAEMIRQADERLHKQVKVVAGLAGAAAAEHLDEVTSPRDAAVVARRVLAERRRALDTAQLCVHQLDKAVQHLSRVMPFLEEGWAEQRALLEHTISEDAQDGLASWLNYWFAAASSRRIDALLRLQSDVTLPPGALIVGERMSIATRALAEKDWQLCREVLEIGGNGLRIGPRQIPDRQTEDDKEPDHSVREDLRLLAARLALHNGLLDQADAMLGTDGENQNTAARLALRARTARLRGADSEAESLLRQAVDLELQDLDVTAESIAQARQRGEPDTALDYARYAVECFLSLADVDGDLGCLVDPSAELWLAIVERAWDEGDHDVARHFLVRAATAAPWDDDEINAAINEKRADLSASAAERRSALISAGALRAGIGQLERARRDYEAAASAQPTGDEDGRVQASARLRWVDVVSAIARQRPYRDTMAELEDVLLCLQEAQAHVDVSEADSWSYMTESDLRTQVSRAQDRGDRYAQEWAALLAAARAVSLNPAWARPWVMLADTLAACRLYRVAEAAAQRAHELGRDEITRAGYIQALIRVGRYEDALRLLGNESDAWARCIRGQVALRLGKADEAIDQFAGVTIGRTWYWAWYSYIRALVIIGDLTAAQVASREFRTAVADREGERAWLYVAAFDARIHGQLGAALDYAEGLLKAAGPGDVRARKVMGETRLLAEDHTGWELLARALAEDPQPTAIGAWEQEERPVLNTLAAARGIELEFARLDRNMRRVRTRPHPGDPMAELRRTATVSTDFPQAAKAARLTEAALRATAGGDDQKLEDLLHRLATEDGLAAEVESLRRNIARPKAQGSKAARARGRESVCDRTAPDNLPVLQLRLPASWLAQYVNPGREHQLLVRYVPWLRKQRPWGVPHVQVVAGDDLEPDRYQILDGRPMSDGHVDLVLRYCPGDTLPLLPTRVRTDPRTVERDYGLDVPDDVLDGDRGLTALLTISAAEAVALLYADAARALDIPLTTPGDDQLRSGKGGNRPGAANLQLTMSVNELAYRRWKPTLNVRELAHRRWEMRGRPQGSPRDAVADWNAAQRLHHQLIAEVAYLGWVNRGRPFGESMADWYAAEAEIASDQAARDQLFSAFVEERLHRQLIEEAAHAHWVSRGQPVGDSWADWHAAETDVVSAFSRAEYACSLGADWLQALRRAFSYP